jgi:type IV secretory pathway VirB6-like protein
MQFLSFSALAAIPPEPPAPEVRPFSEQCPQEGIYTRRVVNCIKNAILLGGQNAYAAMYEQFEPVIHMMVVLAVSMFGLKMITGSVRNLRVESIMLLFKIGLIYYFVRDFGLFEAAFGAFNELMDVVSTSLNKIGQNVGGAPVCPRGLGNPADAAWDKIDCILGHLFGFAPGVTLQGGLLGIVSAAIFSRSIGTMVFMFGISTMVMIMLAAIRAAYVFLMAYSVIALLLMLAPIMFPLILFQPTSGYFNKWWQMMVGFAMQPVILFFFLAFFFKIFEIMIFTGEHSLARALGMPEGGGWDAYSISSIMKDNKSLIDQWGVPSSRDYTDRYDDNVTVIQGSAAPVQTLTEAIAGKVNEVFTNMLNLNIFWVPNIDFGALHVSRMYDLGINLAALAIIAYVTLKMMAHIPMICDRLVGGAISPNLNDKQMPGEQRIQAALAGMDSGMRGNEPRGGLLGGGGIGGAWDNGTSFVTRGVPGGIQGAAQGFISGR